jgi:acetoin utilization protein AcuB
MIVAMWMSTTPVTVAPTVSLSEAAGCMVRHRLRHLLVAERRADGRQDLVGIVSSHDVARAFPPDLNPFSVGALERTVPGAVSAVMTRRVVTVSPQTPVEEAARILRDRRIGALPVVGPAGLAGIITESDILRAFMDVVGVDDHGVRVTFDLSAKEDALTAAEAVAATHGMRIVSLLTMVHDGRRMGVVRVVGPDPEGFTAALWGSGHRVLTVQRTGPAAPGGNPAHDSRP